MPENLGDRERTTAAPDGAEDTAQPERPGYPPPGHAERQAQLAAAEAADQAADGNVEADTDAALRALETPDETERLAAISTWVAEALPDCQPTELAAQACWEIEQEEWEFDPEYRVTEQAPDTIRPFVVEQLKAVELRAVETANAELIETSQAAVAEVQVAVAAGDAEIADQQVAVTTTSADAAAKLGITPVDVAADVVNLTAQADEGLARDRAKADLDESDNEKLQSEYSALRAEHGTIKALRMMADRVEGQAIREVIEQRLATIARLQSALPAKGEAITRLLNTANISLTGPDSAAFADFMTAVDASDEFTDAEKATLRQVLQNDTERPTNASDMQRKLAQGRGTEQITETERVEDPPGSGNYVEREVVVGEKVLPFTEADRLVLSDSNPRVTTYPDPASSTRYRIVAEVEGSAPISIWRDIPETGTFPAADINNAMNELFVDALFRNRGLAGGVQALFGTGDSAFGVATDVDANAIGRVDLTQGFIGMFRGENTTLGNRFLTGSELAELGHDMRHLAPDGDFGAFNQLDPAAAAGLMKALFGEGHAQILANMERARPFINTGGAEAPSYQRLYAKMYPEDAAAGFPRLRERIGDAGMASLALASTETDIDQAA